MFALRVDDLEAGILRIDEALKEAEKGSARVGETGTPYRIGNYLKRVLKPIAKKAGIPDLTYQALRRTFATHFQRYGSPRDAQAQLRHSKLEMTGWYRKQIPETVRAAVEKLDTDICGVPLRTEDNPERIH
jgi:integrase